MLLVEVFCLCYKGDETNEAVAVFLTGYAVGTANTKAKSFMHAMQHAVSFATKLPKGSSSSSSSANVSRSHGCCLHNAGVAVIADSCVQNRSACLQLVNARARFKERHSCLHIFQSSTAVRPATKM